MKLIALLASIALASSPAIAAGPDHVYLYEDGQNRNFQCSTILAYFNTGAESVFYVDKCIETGRDSIQWPQFQPLNVRLSMDFAPTWMKFMEKPQPRIFGNCLFVAHAQNSDRTTSTVIDCRSAGRAGVP